MTLNDPKHNSESANEGSPSSDALCAGGMTNTGLDRSDAFSRILRNGLFNVFGMGISFPLQAISVFLLARRLSPAEFGAYFALFALMSVLHFLGEAGITVTLTRRIAAGAPIRQTFSESLAAYCVCGSVSVVLMLALSAAWFALQAWTVDFVTLGLLAGVMVGFQLQEWCGGVFRGIERFEYENLVRICRSLVSFTSIVVLVSSTDGTLRQALTALCLGTLAGTAVAVALVIRMAGFVPRSNWPTLVTWFRESLPVGFAGVFRRLLWQVDTLVLEFLQTAAVVGMFSLAFRPLQPLQMVPVLIGAITFPLMSRIALRSPRELPDLVERSQRVLLLLSVPVATLMTLLARPVILNTVGITYAPAILPLQIMSWVVVCCFVSAQFRWIFSAVRREAEFARIVMWVFLLKVVVTTGLIWKLGLIGAAAGLLASETALVVAGLVACHRANLKIPGWSTWFKTMAAAGLMTMTFLTIDQVWPAHWPVIAAIVSVPAYLAGVFAFQLIPIEERAQLRTAISGLRSARVAP